ncbi:hypothetical protein [Flavihumibacter petaseus]|uniref:Phage tail collar domain-containing protein n=1 Tax=Flavihumibacter petaseus NBRC 106054 TaxID=1220578 RepID=A0A0E9N196_9BACT|nr:hypothetical protein [Flavihumibacter petaseus]GAO43802.1 hypothetical protein FPE01S_02_09080 [Flavihumibacter petaseus NBRC 106054]
MAEHITVRIPELPAVSDEHPLTLADTFPLWSADDNITRHTTLSKLREFIATGGGPTAAPIVIGNTIYHTVTVGEAGDGEETILSIPSLAGKNYKLRRDGSDMEPGIAFNNLSAGGLQLIRPFDYLVAGQLYVFDLFELAGGSSTPGSGSGSLYKGVIRVDTNKLMAPGDMNKIMQLRGGASAITLTLPDGSLIPANSLTIIESNILNDKHNAVTTSGGQYIYMNGASYNTIYPGIGESVWLYFDEDGWYILNDFGGIYRELGNIVPVYKAGPNDLVLDGSLVSRADNARLWQVVQGFGSSLVSDTTWNTADALVAGRTVQKPYRGCFSTGDGSTTFRLPDYRNMTLRGLKSLIGGDTERFLNRPGGYQRHEFESHDHDVQPPNSNSDSGSGKTATGNDSPEGSIAPYSTSAVGGAETRMDNIGVIWVIKR